MTSFSIVEHLDVFNQIGPGFLSRAIAYAVDTLSLKDGEETLDDGIVVAVASAAHAAGDTIPSEFVTKAAA